MANEKSLVDDTIIQIKNLEEAVKENAKGILSSTMRTEIKELVKESLFEQENEEEIDDTEMEVDADGEVEDTEVEDTEVEDTDLSVDTDIDNFEVDDQEDMEPIDLTGEDISDEEVLRVFELMDANDEVIVKKDTSGNINFKDNSTGKEYMIVKESEYDESQEEESYEMTEEDGESFDDEYSEEELNSIIDRVFSEQNLEETEEEVEVSEAEEDEIVYEIEMEESEDEMEMESEEQMVESKQTVKPKGVGMGKPKFSYNSQKGGFKTVNKKADKTMGTGNAKEGFSYDKSGENLDGEFKIKPKKSETKESARTLGNGSRNYSERKGLPKMRVKIKEDVDSTELTILREKNEEYRKALNVFRNKLNEVAVFNSNLAYATRLFTEHTTTKQEKINILQRFDSVETIKESKNLYKTVKEELSSKKINESIGSVIEKSPSNGSAVNLIESKTYENPQFLRMKDLMTKLK